MVVKPCDALAKPAGLYLVIESASEFPVQFIKVIGQGHHIADNPGTWCRLDDKLDTTEEKVEATIQLLGVVPFKKFQFGTILSPFGIVRYSTPCRDDPIFGGTVYDCEIDEIVTAVQTWRWWTGH